MSDSVGRPRRSREATRQLWAERLARFASAVRAPPITSLIEEQS